MGLGITIRDNEVDFSINIRKNTKWFADELRQLADKLEESAHDLEISRVTIENHIHQPEYNNIIITVPKKYGFNYYIDGKSLKNLSIYYCRGCENKFATEKDKAQPLCCPYCLQQKDFIFIENL